MKKFILYRKHTAFTCLLTALVCLHGCGFFNKDDDSPTPDGWDGREDDVGEWIIEELADE